MALLFVLGVIISETISKLYPESDIMAAQRASILSSLGRVGDDVTSKLGIMIVSCLFILVRLKAVFLPRDSGVVIFDDLYLLIPIR